MRRSITLTAAACLAVLALSACTAQAPTTPTPGAGGSSGVATQAGGATSAPASPSETASTSATSAAATDGEKVPATLARFSKVKEGMTYKQVVAILGAPHVVIGKQTSGDITVEIYGWYGADQFTTAVVSITNGKVTAVRQSGLK